MQTNSIIMASKKEDIKQAVIVDYKAIACKVPGGSSNRKPFIQYSLEWLLIEKFDEIFICCLPDQFKQLREFVQLFSRTEDVPKSMSIQVHSSDTNHSTGDCLRDLDSKALIKADFVIMDVGCCGNLPLAELLSSHKRLRKQDKNAILTSIVRNLFTKNLTNLGEFPIYVSDPKTGLLLHYIAGRVAKNEKPGPISAVGRMRCVQIPSEILLERQSVKIHTNLSSTNLSIYSSNVPALYSELFDCHSEADLIQAAFDNHEVLGGSVYIHVIDDLFSQRMADFGFAINQKREKFDTNLIYKRNERSQVLRKLVNDSLIDCTRLNPELFLSNLAHEEDSDEETESSSEVSMMEDDEIFFGEVLDSLLRGYEETIRNENLILEINSSKHAYNISIDDVYTTIIKALLFLPGKLSSGHARSHGEFASLVEKAIDKFKQLLLNYVKSNQSRATVISTIERLYISNQLDLLNDTVLAKIIYKLYDIDVLDEESILSWYRDYDKSDKVQEQLRSRPAIRQLAQALEAESEDSDDDSD